MLKKHERKYIATIGFFIFFDGEIINGFTDNVNTMTITTRKIDDAMVASNDISLSSHCPDIFEENTLRYSELVVPCVFLLEVF